MLECCAATIRSLPLSFTIKNLECDTCHIPICCDTPMTSGVATHFLFKIHFMSCKECGKVSY